MGKVKSYTDLEQSKKLAEILPLESADMYYQYVLPKSDKVKHNPEIGNPINALEWYNKGYTLGGKEPIKFNEYCVPCWSFAALLSVLPYPHIKQQYDGNWVCRIENKDTTFLWSDRNPIDACYEMILKLNELKML